MSHRELACLSLSAGYWLSPHTHSSEVAWQKKVETSTFKTQSPTHHHHGGRKQQLFLFLSFLDLIQCETCKLIIIASFGMSPPLQMSTVSNLSKRNLAQHDNPLLPAAVHLKSRKSARSHVFCKKIWTINVPTRSSLTIHMILGRQDHHLGLIYATQSS